MDIPVIDLFAGPGGLSEGFSRHFAFRKNVFRYSVKLSVEKEEAAVRTLRLRAFFRSFPDGDVPKEYYDYVRSVSSTERALRFEKLRQHPKWRQARKEVWRKTLGEPGDDKFFKLHRRIKRRIADAPYWVLLGGPPCQAYSVVGRSRRLGDGRDLRMKLAEEELEQRRRHRSEAFFQDEKHTLYREYLEIVALHQPPVFVMENVKGILSSKVPVANATGSESAELIFDRILKDLRDPWIAIHREKLPVGWEQVADGRRFGYSLYSFTCGPNPLTADDHLPEEYLICAENHGVPQERHRVILLGIREDLDAVPVPLAPKSRRVTIEQVIGGLPAVRSGRSGRGKGSKRENEVDSGERWVKAVRDALPDKVISEITLSGVQQGILKVRKNLDPSLTRGGSFLTAPSDIGNLPSELGRWLHDRRLGGIIQHETREHMDADFGRYLFAAVYGQVTGVSPKIRHFPDLLLPHHENVRSASGKRTEAKVFHDRFRVQVKNKPATTIVSHIRKDGHYYIHYDPAQCRSLTVREAARIQTFPDNYFFEGNRTDQYEQVGNAVPPFLALQLADVVTDVLMQVIPLKAKRDVDPTISKRRLSAFGVARAASG